MRKTDVTACRLACAAVFFESIMLRACGRGPRCPLSTACTRVYFTVKYQLTGYAPLTAAALERAKKKRGWVGWGV